MDIYAENILDHYRHPRHKGVLPPPCITHNEENASCGDTLTVSMVIKEGCITAIGWAGEGCAISQAGMSMLAETLEGMTLERAMQLKPIDIQELLKVPVGPRRIKCALLCLHALKNGINAWSGKPSQTWQETLEE